MSADQVSQALGTLYATLQPAARRALLQRIAIAVRREQGQRIASQQDPYGRRFAPRAVSKGPSRRTRGTMFARLRLIRNMAAQTQGDDAVVAFASRVQRVAQVHHYGEMDRPSHKQQPVRYPVRELLGISAHTQRIVQDALQAALLRSG